MMTVNDLRKLITDEYDRRQELCTALIAAARPAVNILKDLGHKSSAAAIEEVLFQIDAASQSTVAAIKDAGPQAFMELLRIQR